jgi:serine/threonine protein kinase/Tol biopolymer transport system component
MPLTPGSKLGPYEIQSSLGAGGMGEVYAARDTRLDRTVAIKILPEHLSEKPEAHARFEREARAVSSLNHPHICQLYDIGEQSGVRYIVMEHLHGETLADRLKKGPLSLDQLTRIGADIGDGLQCAHRNGIVHRDLKPGNIMLTKAGAKILDFGLAKGGSVTGSAHDLMVTLSSPALSDSLTAEGSLVGTFQYMAPEQVEGKEATPSSDIFSFGSVLYEMATGKRAFEGKTQISVASSIIERDPPPVVTIIPTAPPALDHVIRGCLAKDPDARWHSAGDVARELRWIGSNSNSTSSSQLTTIAAPPLGRRLRERAAWAALAATLLGIVLWLALRPASSTPVVHSSLLSPPDTVFDFDGDFSGPPVLSADGTQVAFCAHPAKERESIWVRPLNSNAPRKLAGTEGATFPFWSPDGLSIAFFADQKLKTIPVAGGPVSSVADAPNPRGGAWGADNAIVYTPDYRDALWIVHPHQADARRLTTLDPNVHSTHRWPSFLPDGKHFLFLATSHGGAATDRYGIYIGSTDGHQSGLVLSSDSAAQYAGGYLLFHRESQLMAQKLNWRDGTLSGTPMTLVDKVDYDAGTWHTTFTASDNGMLIYQAATVKTGYDFMWLDRKGNVIGKAAESLAYNGERISPDGKRVAVALGDPKPDIWIFDFARGSRTRLTYDAGVHSMPSWSGNGQRVLYVTQMGMSVATGSSIRAKQSSGTGQEEIILDGGTAPGGPFSYLFPQWTPDGKYLAYQKQNGPLNSTFWAQSTTGDQKPFLVLQPQSPQGRIIQTRLSPDGHWLAYTSTDSGREDVYVTTFPTPSGRWQISQGGGGYPFWRGDGKELYFAGLSDATAYAVELKINGNQLEAGIPQPLFVVRNTSSVGTLFDVAPDGQRFLVPLTQRENADAPMSLVTNWPALLNK